jgi:hypothetical protein
MTNEQKAEARRILLCHRCIGDITIEEYNEGLRWIKAHTSEAANKTELFGEKRKG